MKNSAPDDIFSRHHLLTEIGHQGQAKLLRSHVAVVGVGAVGSRSVEILIRAGVGRLTVIDRDEVEFSNLQRQTLYTWNDAENSIPKAEAARRHLNCILPTCQVFPHVINLGEDNIDSLLGGADVVADGTDNVETRYIVNDWCIANGIRWVYAGAVGTRASVFPVTGKHACLRCAFPDPPTPESVPTANDIGVLAAAAAIAAARSSSLVLRFLLGDTPESMWETYDVWSGTHSSLSLEKLQKSHGNKICPICG